MSEDNAHRAQWQRVKQTFGDKLLDYLAESGSDTSESEMASALSDAVATLDQLRMQAAIAGHPPELGLMHLANQGVNDLHQPSPLNQLRVRQYEVPEPPEDPLLAAFNRYAYEAYPYLLVQHHRKSLGMTSTLLHTSGLLFNHPVRSEFERYFMDDDNLSSLVPMSEDNGTQAQSYIAESSGRAGTCQLAVLAGSLVDVAFFLSAFHGHGSLDDFFQATTQVIEMLRNAATDGCYYAPAFSVLTHISIDDVGPIQLDDLTVHPWNPELNPYFPSEARPAKDAEGRHFGVLLESMQRVDVDVIDPSECADDETTPAVWQDGLTEQIRKIEDVRLSSLLAVVRGCSDEHTVVAPQETCTYTTSLFHPYSYSWSGKQPVGANHVLTQAEATHLKEVHRQVSQTDRADFQIGVQRLIQAASERGDAQDAFIDAIICWENLFGDPQGELGFRVSVAMTRLIATEPEEGKRLQDELKDIYNQRSKLVHGASLKKEAKQLRDRAIYYAARSLSILYLDRPDLLPVGSKDRTLHLVLGSSPKQSESDDGRSQSG